MSARRKPEGIEGGKALRGAGPRGAATAAIFSRYEHMVDWRLLGGALKVAFPYSYERWGVSMSDARWLYDSCGDSITLVFTKTIERPAMVAVQTGKRFDFQVERLELDQVELMKARSMGMLGDYLSEVIGKFLDEKFSVPKAETVEDAVVVRKTIECGHCGVAVGMEDERCEHCGRAFYL